MEALTRWWSRGNSKRRSHPTKMSDKSSHWNRFVCNRKLSSYHGSTARNTRFLISSPPCSSSSSLQWPAVTRRCEQRVRSGFKRSLRSKRPKRDRRFESLRSSNESQRTAGRCRSNREHQRGSPAGRGWPIPPRPTERTPIRRPSHGLRDAANNSAAESRLTNDSPRLRKRARRVLTHNSSGAKLAAAARVVIDGKGRHGRRATV